MKLLIQLVREILHLHEKVTAFQKPLAVVTMSCFLNILRKPIFSVRDRRQLCARLINCVLGSFASFWPDSD